jgi:hypothetical protein
VTELELSYALAKQVPDVALHATFETNYGTLRLDYEDSQKVAELVEKLLLKKLLLKTLPKRTTTEELDT